MPIMHWRGSLLPNKRCHNSIDTSFFFTSLTSCGQKPQEEKGLSFYCHHSSEANFRKNIDSYPFLSAAMRCICVCGGRTFVVRLTHSLFGYFPIVDFWSFASLFFSLSLLLFSLHPLLPVGTIPKLTNAIIHLWFNSWKEAVWTEEQNHSISATNEQCRISFFFSSLSSPVIPFARCTLAFLLRSIDAIKIHTSSVPLSYRLFCGFCDFVHVRFVYGFVQWFAWCENYAFHWSTAAAALTLIG